MANSLKVTLSTADQLSDDPVSTLSVVKTVVPPTDAKLDESVIVTGEDATAIGFGGMSGNIFVWIKNTSTSKSVVLMTAWPFTDKPLIELMPGAAIGFQRYVHSDASVPDLFALGSDENVNIRLRVRAWDVPAGQFNV